MVWASLRALDDAVGRPTRLSVHERWCCWTLWTCIWSFLFVSQCSRLDQWLAVINIWRQQRMVRIGLYKYHCGHLHCTTFRQRATLYRVEAQEATEALCASSACHHVAPGLQKAIVDVTAAAQHTKHIVTCSLRNCPIHDTPSVSK